MSAERRLLLAIDCTGPTLALALAAIGASADPLGLSRPMARGHDEAIIPAIADLLATAQATRADLAGIAVVTGPGSYTGIRVGIAAARGLALARGIAARGWSALECLDSSARHQSGDARILALIASRGGACYHQGFESSGRAMAPPGCDGIGTIARLYHGRIDRIAGHLPSALGAHFGLATSLAPAPGEGLAIALARRAAAEWDEAGARIAAPLYLREAEVHPSPAPALPVFAGEPE
ncbi:MAG: hypothetical protein Kow00104_20130 [Rhodothalassiaceae bacterium]